MDWGAISGAASAAASIAAVASIVLAYKGVRLSRDSSLLDRRNYLDGIFVRWLDAVDALDRAALPYVQHVPTQAELDAGAIDLPDAYAEFHMAFTHCKTATNLLDSTGIFDSSTKDDQPGEMATTDLIKIFIGILWAHYFSLIANSAAEIANYGENQRLAQPWRSAVGEVEASLAEHAVPDRYFPLFEDKVRELYPESSPVGVWQVSDRLLDVCKAEIVNRYMLRVDSRFPWDRRS
jgi:hypothetical protein